MADVLTYDSAYLNAKRQEIKNDISYVLCPSGKKNVKLPNGIKSLSGFDGCKSLESIEIPDSVEYIGDGFKHTPLLDNQKGPVKYVGKWAISCDSDAADKVELKSDTIGISNGAFTNCKMKELVIPKSVKYIGGVGIVFGGELEKVEILNPDVEIRSFAFSGSNVKELILPMGMKEIGEAAFANYDGTSERFLYTRSTPTVFAGSRYQYLAPKIKFGYNELVNAIGEAIDKAVELDGAQVTDNTVIAQIKTRPFADIMAEAKEVWSGYLNSAETDEQKEQHLNIMRDIIKKVFGTEDFKLSQAVPSQADLVELFIDEMRDII